MPRGCGATHTLRADDLANLAANLRSDLFGSRGRRRGAQPPDIQRHTFSGGDRQQMLDPGVAEIQHFARRQSSHQDLKEHIVGPSRVDPIGGQGELGHNLPDAVC